MTSALPDANYVPFTPGEQILAGLWKPTAVDALLHDPSLIVVYSIHRDGTVDVLANPSTSVYTLLQQGCTICCMFGNADGWSVRLQKQDGQTISFAYLHSPSFRQPAPTPDPVFHLAGLGSFLDTSVYPPTWATSSPISFDIQGATIQSVYGRLGTQQADLFLQLTTGQMYRIVVLLLEITTYTVYLYETHSEFAQPIAELPLQEADFDSLIDYIDRHTRSIPV